MPPFKNVWDKTPSADGPIYYRVFTAGQQGEILLHQVNILVESPNKKRCLLFK